MRVLLMVYVWALGTLFAPLAAGAQTWVDQSFDARNLSREDTATVQAALAFTGDYFGYVDGVWNPESQTAFTNYVQRVASRPQPSFGDLKDLVMFLEDERVASNWQLNHSSESNLSYLYPFGLLEAVENKDWEEYISKDGNFSLVIREDDQIEMKKVHDWFLGKAKAGSKPFHFSDTALMITWAEIEDGMTAYARSDLVAGRWSTMSIVVTPDHYFRLNLLAGSTAIGTSPTTLIWTPGGVLDQLINSTPAAAAGTVPPLASLGPRAEDQVERPVMPGTTVDAPPPEIPEGIEVAEVPSTPMNPGPVPGEKPANAILGTPGPSSPPAADPGALPAVVDPGASIPVSSPALGTAPGGPAPIRAPGNGTGAVGTPPPGEGLPKIAPVAEIPRPKVSGTLKGSGTGFYIAPTTLVTAAHVIEGCSSVGMVDGTALEIIAADSSLDVAVLGGASDAGAWLKLSALEVPKLGEAVTVLGFPYFTSLDQGLTVTSGNVSALRGVDGSSNRVMITAPVQPGNSGGPLMSKKGAVIGVVVSRVDDMAMLEETGSLPQNMNFAVPSGPLLTFLAQNRISRPQGDGTGGDFSGEMSDGLTNAVVPVHCYR